MTPITVTGSPLMRSERPIASRALPKRWDAAARLSRLGEIVARPVDGGEALETLRPRVVIDKIRGRVRPALRLRRGAINADEPRVVGIGRAEHQRLEHAE